MANLVAAIESPLVRQANKKRKGQTLEMRHSRLLGGTRSQETFAPNRDRQLIRYRLFNLKLLISTCIITGGALHYTVDVLPFQIFALILVHVY